MKRYWKLSTLTVFIVVVLTGFFIQSSFAFSNYPEFILKHQSGDEKLGSKIEVEGNYSDHSDSFGNSLSIDEEGTTYLQTTYLSQLQNPFLGPEIKQLQKKYKSFMRGKSDYIGNYYENKDTLAYVNIETDTNFTGYAITDQYFDIEVLDKETGDRQAFQLELPDRKYINFSDVRGVTLHGDELKIITNLSFYDELCLDREEKHVFSFYVIEREILDDEWIVTNEEDMNQEYDVWTDIEPVPWELQQNPEYFVFIKSTHKNIERDDGHYESEMLENEYIVYHIASGEHEGFELPDEWKDDNTLLHSWIEGEHLLFYEIDNNELKLYDYNLSSQQFDDKKHFDLPEGATEEAYVTIQDDKVIVANRYHQGSTSSAIIIYDYDSEDKLYERIIDIEGNEPTANDELIIHDVQFQ